MFRAFRATSFFIVIAVWCCCIKPKFTVSLPNDIAVAVVSAAEHSYCCCFSVVVVAITAL